MVGRSTLKQYGFNGVYASAIEEYYIMVRNSWINGNFKQCKEQFNKLSNKQKYDFLSQYVIWRSDEYLFYLKVLLRQED